MLRRIFYSLFIIGLLVSTYYSFRRSAKEQETAMLKRIEGIDTSAWVGSSPYQIPIETEKIDFHGVDTVTLYLNPKAQQEYYDYILSLKPRRVIFNPGTENPELYKILEANNIKYEVACTLVLLATNQY